jgi:hypothetical protein
LWNGEYYAQLVDLVKHPSFQYGDGCLSDQMFGQNWAHQVSLGHLYDPANVRAALEAVWKYNWAPDTGKYNAKFPPERVYANSTEAGLFICTWPKSTHPKEGVRYRDEIWTGIEYQVAAGMIYEGMVEEGLAICRAVHDRYHPLKRNPYNEVECSDFYARAMASWGVLLALSGFEYHGPKGWIKFRPRLTPERFRCAFTAAEGWGTFDQEFDTSGSAQYKLTLRHGSLRLNSMSLGLPTSTMTEAGSTSSRGDFPTKLHVAVSGVNLNTSYKRENDFLHISFASEITMNLQDELLISAE